MIATDAVTLWQNRPKEPHAELHVVAASPFSARYRTSVDTAPAARIMYVSTYQRKYIGQFFQYIYYNNIYREKELYTNIIHTPSFNHNLLYMIRLIIFIMTILKVISIIIYD